MTTNCFNNDHDDNKNTSIDDKYSNILLRKKIRIVGGGLAGLSMAYHLLKQQPPSLPTFMSTIETTGIENQHNTTQQQQQYIKHPKVNVDIIIDDIVEHIGQGGASAIAGG
jgi:hypothetical protein